MMDVKVKRSSGGIWECRLYLGRSLTGKPIRKYRRFPEAESEQQAQALAEQWAGNLTAGGVVKSAVLPDLLDEYVATCKRRGAAANSIRGWKRYVRYVRRFMRRANARDLTAMDFNRFFDALTDDKEAGGAGLGLSTALNVYSFLRAAYNYFIDAGICTTNPLVFVKKPAPHKSEARTLANWDARTLNERIESDLRSDMGTADGYEAALFALADWIALNMGLRVGEVCALRRCDLISGREPFLHVCGTVIEPERGAPYRQNHPKGKRSRNVSVSADEMGTIERFVTAQNAVLGNLDGEAPLVTKDGSWMRPTTVSRRFKKLCRECGMPAGVSFHTLRHTHASLLISEGYSIKAIAQRMGHAQPSTTLNEYGHLVPGDDKAAPDVLKAAKRRVMGVPKVNQNGDWEQGA